MHLDWLLHPALPYAAVAIGMVSCLFLFASVQYDLRLGEARSKKKLAALESDWNAKLEVLGERWEELSRVSELLVPPSPPRSGLNLNKRSQALQMLRRGETPEEIAATLAIPQNEVELLEKVQRIALSGIDPDAAGDSPAPSWQNPASQPSGL